MKKHTPQRKKVKVPVPGKRQVTVLTHDDEDANRLGDALARLSMIADAIGESSRVLAELPEDATEQQANLACAAAYASLHEWMATDLYKGQMRLFWEDISIVKGIYVSPAETAGPRRDPPEREAAAPPATEDAARPEDPPSAHRILPLPPRAHTGETLTGLLTMLKTKGGH